MLLIPPLGENIHMYAHKEANIKMHNRKLNLCNFLTVLPEHIRKFIHYPNAPMQYTAIFHGCKNENLQMKNYIYFLLFALKR